MSTQTLKDFLPSEFTGSEYLDTPAYQYLDVPVVQEYGAGSDVHRLWPGTHKHIYCWCILENGKAVGWNENPGKGWSFPVMTAPKHYATKVKILTDESCSSYTSGDTEDQYGHGTVEDNHVMVTGIEISKDYFDLIAPFGIKKHVNYYLVQGTYSTGDSFNSTHGVAEHVALYTTEAAAKRCVDALKQHSAEYDNDNDEGDRSVVLTDDIGTEFKYGPPWLGYFETLSCVEIITVSL